MKIAVSGSKGKMGASIIRLAKDHAGLEVSGQFDAGEDADAPIQGCDCLIEFTSPEATIEHAAICEKHKKAMVIGTTGLNDGQMARIKEASLAIPIVFSPNMSVGVNVIFKMVEEAARLLGPEYDINILEAHHVNKKDAPSGTAKELARIIESKRTALKVPIESIREDEIVGEHTVTFDSPVDLIELTHSAKTRDIFAEGALKAAAFVSGKKAGLYNMKDVLKI